ncbi:MAG: Uncharacterised protein [Glaciecola sp. HTCC2999]|jgi:uncharacterized protein YehS (DUF1456 family)|nr:MAG: Uncharacterised protein [Glaciecola sp. HTCC2999]
MFLNDVFRRLRYALGLNNSSTISLCKLMDYELDESYLTNMMKREEEDGFMPCRDKILCIFLDALIIKNRGKQDGSQPHYLTSGQRLTNNEIMRKIKIAMNYQQDDMLAILESIDFRVSKGELTALFRKPDHRSYRECGDQLLRNFLKGMVKRHRPDAAKKSHQTAK